MSFQYELIVTCAIAALAIMHIINLQRRIMDMRKRQRALRKSLDVPRNSTAKPSSGADGSPDLGLDSNDRRYSNFILALLILMLIWMGYRIWMEI